MATGTSSLKQNLSAGLYAKWAAIRPSASIWPPLGKNMRRLHNTLLERTFSLVGDTFMHASQRPCSQPKSQEWNCSIKNGYGDADEMYLSEQSGTIIWNGLFNTATFMHANINSYPGHCTHSCLVPPPCLVPAFRRCSTSLKRMSFIPRSYHL